MQDRSSRTCPVVPRLPLCPRTNIGHQSNLASLSFTSHPLIAQIVIVLQTVLTQCRQLALDKHTPYGVAQIASGLTAAALNDSHYANVPAIANVPEAINVRITASGSPPRIMPIQAIPNIIPDTKRNIVLITRPFDVWQPA